MDVCNKEDNCGNGVLQPEKFSPRIALESSQTVLINPVFVVGFYIVHVHCTEFSSMESGLTLRMLGASLRGSAATLRVRSVVAVANQVDVGRYNWGVRVLKEWFRRCNQAHFKTQGFESVFQSMHD